MAYPPDASGRQELLPIGSRCPQDAPYGAFLTVTTGELVSHTNISQGYCGDANRQGCSRCRHGYRWGATHRCPGVQVVCAIACRKHHTIGAVGDDNKVERPSIWTTTRMRWTIPTSSTRAATDPFSHVKKKESQWYEGYSRLRLLRMFSAFVGWWTWPWWLMLWMS